MANLGALLFLRLAPRHLAPDMMDQTAHSHDTDGR